MKKHNIITTVLFLPLLMLCTSCWNSVLYEIRKDVAPESATVSGNIPQITRFTLNDEEYIFVSANGGLRYKKADNQEHGSWATMTVPFELLHFDYDTTSMVGRQIAGVFANTDTLYLIAVPYSTSGSEGTTNPLTLELWASKTPDVTASWTQLNKDSAIN